LRRIPSAALVLALAEPVVHDHRHRDLHHGGHYGVTDLWAAVQEHGSKRAAARALGMAESTFRARLAGRPALRVVPDGLSQDIGEQFTEVPVVVRDYSHLDRLRVYPLGDVHKGAQSHQADRWREWISYLCERDDVSMIGTGDFLNAALKDSKSDSYEEMMPVGRAKRELRKELQPLADTGRLDILIPGNHEQRIHRAVGDCPIEDIADVLGCPYAKSAALLVYRVGDVEYEFFVRHGTGGGQSLNGLMKGAMMVDADVYVTGHIHQQAIRVDEHFRREGDRVVRHKRVYCSSGSFLGLESYALERGYVPGRIGAPRLHLDGRRKDVHASL
jgi:predicted phosphodiesterase